MYTIVQNMNHEKQELEASLEWHEAMAHFKTDRERDAYKAGFSQGWGKNRVAIVQHTGVKIADPKKGETNE